MNTTEKTVLVTGASTGIGRATAILLDSLGFTVFAGVRKESDSEALARLPRPLRDALMCKALYGRVPS